MLLTPKAFRAVNRPVERPCQASVSGSWTTITPDGEGVVSASFPLWSFLRVVQFTPRGSACM